MANFSDDLFSVFEETAENGHVPAQDPLVLNEPSTSEASHSRYTLLLFHPNLYINHVVLFMFSFILEVF